MDSPMNLQDKFNEIFIEMEFFVAKSSLIYVEGSSEMVEGGAYKWANLDAADTEVQRKLCAKYVRLIDLIHYLEMEGDSSDDLDCSSRRVLRMLRQDGAVLQNTTRQVCEDIAQQLDLQLILSESFR